ncbi:hypothetical protein KO481_36130 [Nocardia sp. NEAU-G5]|uniref:Uncharacterized protein n=1 Tax=Nocardia albiluteola TaxID=2842303 RepID=A0ABS6B9W5_9NOCA|nr:hypothetical protein [Nocardia albiluteola]MBU3066938.1 hypothetical protein [Nocardia albiluteola]
MEHHDNHGYADIGEALSKPLSDVQIARHFPTLGIATVDSLPHVKGKLREYISL